MAKYRKISPCIWNDEKVRGMTDKGKLALLFLLTHPHMTALGAIRANIPGLAFELGWSTEDFAKAFREALVKGIAQHDEKACLIWFPKFLKHNSPESPNVVKSWAGAYEELPECPLKKKLLFSVSEYIKTLPKGFREAFREVFGEVLAKGMPNQEQEQEQEQEQDLNTICAERLSASTPEPPEDIPEEPPVEFIPLPGVQGEFPVSQVLADELQRAFPGVNIRAELAKARAWCVTNPTKRKTAKGVPRFLNGWMERAQNSGRSSPGGGAYVSPAQRRLEANLEAARDFAGVA